ncbi:MAG: hypothetical protein ACRDUS_04490 [Mycobacterium sp.]
MLFFGLWTLYTTAVDSRPDWVQRVIVATFFGLMMGPTSAHRSRREVAPLIAGVAPRDYRLVSKALRMGPPPSDPVILHAAAQLAHIRAAQSMADRKVSMIFAAVGVLLLVALAVGHTFHPAGYVTAVLVGVLGAYGWINPLLLQARSMLLTDAARQNRPPSGLGGTAPPSVSTWHEMIDTSTSAEMRPHSPDFGSPHRVHGAAKVVTSSSSTTGLYSFRGRVATSIVVIAIGVFGLWAYFQYHHPQQFWLSLFPLALGTLGIRDAVKRKRAGFFDVKVNE